jgi:DNA-binding response OmpR family regulator
VHASTGSLRTRSFGVFEADLRVAELRKFGIKIKLLEHPFQLLALLLPHPGELVTSDEIRQALWPVHTLVDPPNQDRNRGLPRSTRA